MASIQKRKNKNGTSHWRAVVRIKGYPTVCNHFERKQEADDWAAEVERQIKLGKFQFDQHKSQHTFSQLVERYKNDGALQHIRSVDDVIRHLEYWNTRLGSFSLVYLTPELLGKERQYLAELPTAKGVMRNNATTNRYMSSLSAILTYAKRLRWITENPCFGLMKLKEAAGRDRVLTEDEITKLLAASRESRSPYLYCVILISLTTGARQGEILNLEWGHIDFENRIAHLKETKNGRPRSISLSDAVLAELQRLYEVRNPAKPRVFASKTAFGQIDLKNAWKSVIKRSNINDLRPHDMRHTFCTLAARQGASNLELATATGHRTLNMLRRYTHLDVKVTKKFSTKISEQILQGVSA